MSKTILPDNKKGYIFEVGLNYPQELHGLYNDSTLAPEKMNVTPDMLSPYCKNIQEQFGIQLSRLLSLFHHSPVKELCIAL